MTAPTDGGMVMHGFEPATIEARIRAYERFGIHRTGWPGDDATSDWLVEELGRLGVAADTERFTFPRVETRRTRLTWGTGPRDYADGVPMYDGGFTRAGGIDGELVSDEDGDPFGKIVVFASAAARGPAGNPPTGARETFGELARSGAVGAVVPTGEGPSIRLRNAGYIDRPYSLPVLQVAPDDIRDLAAAMIIGVEGVLEIDGGAAAVDRDQCRRRRRGYGPRGSTADRDHPEVWLVHVRCRAWRRDRGLACARRALRAHCATPRGAPAGQFGPRTASPGTRALAALAHGARAPSRADAAPRRLDRGALSGTGVRGQQHGLARRGARRDARGGHRPGSCDADATRRAG